MSTKKKHIVLKVILALLLVIIIAGAGFSLWFANHYKSIIKAKLPGLVAKATDSLYRISIQDVSINLVTRKVTITGIKLWADTARVAALYKEGKAPGSFFNIAIPSVQVSGLQWENLATDKELDMGGLTIYEPDIMITTPAVDSLHPQNPKKQDTAKLELVTARMIDIVQPAVTYRQCRANDTSFFRVNGGEIKLANWKFDPQQPDTTRFFYAEKAALELDSFSFRKPGSQYGITLDHIGFATDSSRLSLKGLEVNTTVSHQEFYKEVGHQKDIFHLVFRSVQLNGFDWKQMLRNKVFVAENALLEDALIDIYFSRLPPPNTESKMGRFPNQLLAKLPLKLNIAAIKVRNGHFKYTEINEETKLPGVLLFDDIGGNISNITNIDEAVATNNDCIIKLQGKFMKKSSINAIFHLKLNDKDGSFSVDGGLTDLDAAQINDATKALAKAEIKSLHVRKLDLHVAGNEHGAHGDITMLYSNLNIALQKVADSKQLSNTPLLSFLANSLLLYTDNPMPKEAARTAHTDIKRDPYKSFFNLIWKCIFNGIQRTAIKSDNIERALEEKQADKGKPGKEKKSFLRRIFSRHK